MKDLYAAGKHPKNKRSVGKKEGMDVGWVKRKKPAMWAVSQVSAGKLCVCAAAG